MDGSTGSGAGSKSEVDRGQSKSNFDKALMVLLVLLGGVSLVLIALVPLRFLPAEDAVILFQYSRNLAAHGAITFLAHGPRVEGATDFAWMTLVAGGMRWGIAPYWTSAFANVVALLTLAVMLLRLAQLPITLRRSLYGEVDRECWLIRRDSPLRAAIAEILREHHGVAPEKALALEMGHRGAR